MIWWSIAAAWADPAAPTWSGPIRVRRCDAVERRLPDGMEAVLAGVVVVRAGDRVGSGVIVSSDGFVLTAAHVVEGVASADVQLRAGIALPAEVVRQDAAADVALLRVTGGGFTCATVASPPLIGAELYAVGSPLGQGLEFTVSRGILGGQREVEGRRLLQTDASINSGNSGGPLFDGGGRAVGIVTFKAVGDGVEGIGFGVPVDSAVTALEILWADASDDASDALAGERPPPAPPPPEPLAAAPWAPGSEGPDDASPLDEPRVIGGTVLASAGWIVVAATTIVWAGDPSVSAAEWRSIQLLNAGGWVVAGIGTGVIVSGSVNASPGFRLGGRF